MDSVIMTHSLPVEIQSLFEELLMSVNLQQRKQSYSLLIQILTFYHTNKINMPAALEGLYDQVTMVDIIIEISGKNKIVEGL